MRYILFRTWFALKRKSGLLQNEFPVLPPFKIFITLNDWKQEDTHFFFQFKEDILPMNVEIPNLKEKAEKILEGKFEFFNSLEYDLGSNYDWITNPETGYKYDINKHWVEINDYSKEAGDIKFVWEKSRFSFLYTLIRYDLQYNIDVSSFVFDEIVHWINANPINKGPNYKCSQEISLRILNWTFALNYYKNSTSLTEEIFQKIIFSIYWQLKHVYSNINFSRIAVRNNHAITETLTLFLGGILYPFFPEATKWKLNGKKSFEKEIVYQIYDDGSFLQFSMNYHRVVVQLLTWAIQLSELNNVRLHEVVYKKAKATLNFLATCMDKESGWLPNYGANDGALFFPLNDNHFRDYRPQLQALSQVLGISCGDPFHEDQYWYGLRSKVNIELEELELSSKTINEFHNGGYYILKEEECMSFIRCGNHKDRPSQADNLHLDLWVLGQNILRDGGSYKYNADEKSLRYFFGTESHNTVMLGNHDQMLKGGRFIWYHWTQSIKAGWIETETYYEFKGAIKAFQQIDQNIVHARMIRKYKGEWKWEVTDVLNNTAALEIHQLWHPVANNVLKINFSSFDENENPVPFKKDQGWYSSLYGIKEEVDQLVFSTSTKKIRTVITITDNT